MALKLGDSTLSNTIDFDDFCKYLNPHGRN